MSRLIAISGSLRDGSLNTALLGHARDIAPEGMVVVHWDRLAEVPPFSEDDEEDPPAVVRDLRLALAASDGLLVVTPEYNGSLPGQLKNALDWASRPFPDNCLQGLPAALVGASPSPGGTGQAQEDGRRVLARAGAAVIEANLEIAHAHEHLDADRLGETQQERLVEVLEALAGRIRGSGRRDGSDDVAA